MSRKDNTLKFTPIDETGVEGTPKYIPVEGVSDLFCFGSLDANSALYNFLGKAGIAVHFFDYYEHYTGSFAPKEYLLAGKMQIEQTKRYIDKKTDRDCSKIRLWSCLQYGEESKVLYQSGATAPSSYTRCHGKLW